MCLTVRQIKLPVTLLSPRKDKSNKRSDSKRASAKPIALLPLAICLTVRQIKLRVTLLSPRKDKSNKGCDRSPSISYVSNR
jgi:hypothetical protein